MTIWITPEGTVRTIYRDEDAELIRAIGPVRLRRASDVEPSGEGTDFVADMARSGGPVLGPFPTRQAALDAEVAWLEAHALGAVR